MYLSLLGLLCERGRCRRSLCDLGELGELGDLFLATPKSETMANRDLLGLRDLFFILMCSLG